MAANIEEYRAYLTLRGVNPTALTVDKSGTIVPTIAATQQAAIRDAKLEALAAADASWQRSLETVIVVGDTLGEGGMGLVRLAEQRALLREVAVKCLKPTAQGADHASLVREARVTGALEHPNVVPVYDLGVDDEGAPVLVMKRIEGETWQRRLNGVKRPLSGTELERQLQILLSVATALHFAHERGLIHRDVKPENVMIGRFGEVYLLDWGIAISVDRRSAGIAPSVEDVSGIAGTPAFMAPEMAAADSDALGPATDVFLLGGALHYILTGRPTHEGDNVIALMAAAFAALEPELPESTPEELAELCRKALAPTPEERFADAGEFRHALATYLERRPSLLLVHEALDRLESWGRVRAGMDRPPEPGDLEDQRLRTEFSAARFGLQAALREWPGNARAQEVLDHALADMAEYEIWVSAPRSAQHWLNERKSPAPEDVAASVQQALAEQDARDARLRKFERDSDTSVSITARGWLVVAMGAGWFLSAVGLGYLDRNGIYTTGHGDLALLFVIWGAITGFGYQFTRKLQIIKASRVNEHLIGASVLAQVSQVGLVGVAYMMDIELTHTIGLCAVVGWAVWSMVGLTVDKRMFPMAVCLGAGAVPVELMPAWRFEWLALSAGLGMLLVGIGWLSSSRANTEARA